MMNRAGNFEAFDPHRPGAQCPGTVMMGMGRGYPP